MNHVIYTQNLTKSFKRIIKKGFFNDLLHPQFEQVNAVKEISLAINKGESVAFLGPNGAGKTTTIKMLTGLIYPTDGMVRVLGYKPFERDKKFLKRIGLVMGNKAGLNWDLTPRQSFELLKHIYEIPENKFLKRIKELTELLDTAKFMDTQVRRLSLGERMKMELIGAILHDPDVLFLDEPTIGLDIISKQKIREFLRKIQKEMDVTMLLTSHDMDDVEKVCDRVIVINKGMKVYDDKIGNLTEKYNSDKFVKLIFEKMPQTLDLGKVEIVENGENHATFKVNRNDMSYFIANATKRYDLADIDIISVPLDEIIADVFRNA